MAVLFDLVLAIAWFIIGVCAHSELIRQRINDELEEIKPEIDKISINDEQSIFFMQGRVHELERIVKKVLKNER